MSKTPRGNKNSKAEIAARQARIAEDIGAGVIDTVGDYAALLGISRQTLWRDLQALKARYVEGSEQDVRAFKAAQYDALIKIEEHVALGTVPPEVGNTLIRIRDAVARLLGLNEAEKRITAHLDVDTSGRFHKFVQAAAGLSDAQLERVFEFAVSLPRKQLPMPGGPPLQMLEGGS